jgi:hypothetical protein
VHLYPIHGSHIADTASFTPSWLISAPDRASTFCAICNRPIPLIGTSKEWYGVHQKAANHLEQLANANAGSTIVQHVRWLCKGQDRIHCIKIDLAEGDILIVCWLTIYVPEFAVSVNNMNLWFNHEGDWKCGVLIRKFIGLLQAL